MLKKYKNSRSGLVILEAILAATVAIVGLLGILTLVGKSLTFNFDASQKFIATYLAAEGVEIVKSLIDENYTREAGSFVCWNDGIDDGFYAIVHDCSGLNNGTGCSFVGNLSDDIDNIFANTPPLRYIPASGVYGYFPPQFSEPTHFKRIVRIENIFGETTLTSYEIKVNSFVRFASRGRTETVELEDHFFDWRSHPPCSIL